jgi:hypothetical protein
MMLGRKFKKEASATLGVVPYPGHACGSCLLFSAVSQALALIFTGLIGDFGVALVWTLYSILTFWTAAGLIMMRRRKHLTGPDIGFVRYGFFFIFLTYILFGNFIYEYVQRVVLNR